MKCKIIRRVPGSTCNIGDIIESQFCWYLVDLGYAVPLDFEWKVDPVKAAKARIKLEKAYEGPKKAKATKAIKGFRRS